MNFNLKCGCENNKLTIWKMIFEAHFYCLFIQKYYCSASPEGLQLKSSLFPNMLAFMVYMSQFITISDKKVLQ